MVSNHRINRMDNKEDDDDEAEAVGSSNRSSNEGKWSSARSRERVNNLAVWFNNLMTTYVWKHICCWLLYYIVSSLSTFITVDFVSSGGGVGGQCWRFGGSVVVGTVLGSWLVVLVVGKCPGWLFCCIKLAVGSCCWLLLLMIDCRRCRRWSLLVSKCPGWLLLYCGWYIWWGNISSRIKYIRLKYSIHHIFSGRLVGSHPFSRSTDCSCWRLLLLMIK